MKVMLLSLPGFGESDGALFPLGIGYLVGALKNVHDVEALHFNYMSLAKKEVPQYFNTFKPGVVGITCNTFNRGFVKEMIRILRNLDKDVQIVVGGVHATYCYDQILTRYGADIVVIGEGEYTMLDLCNAIENNVRLNTVKGIAFKEKGETVVTPPRESVANLDDLPVPDYSYARKFIEATEMGFMITSRGCPVRCTFCSTSSYWGQKVRTYSVTRVVDEMEMLISQFKVKKIFFHDDTFNLGIPRVKAICKEIMDRGIRIDWACSCRVVPASEDMIEAMVRAGCKHICWGIESGSEKMLEKINKKITRTQIRHAFELSNKFSNVMSTGAFAMVGNPGETAETIHETVKFMDTIAITDAPSTSVLYVLPGTLLYNTLKQTGQIRDEDWANFDSVPFYTIDNSYITMKHWANLVRNSGKRVTFKQEHFWSGTLATSDKKKVTLQNGRFKNLLRIVMHPAHIVSSAKSYLPSGKIHF